ncbi:50S ribosomal protein L25 [Rhabdothermincola sp.]|uniref:50S ribosomal protein L25 n=1 Tax=Rhabdothermincola sp. TaxID=2820405 RepID=UPI002FE1916C
MELTLTAETGRTPGSRAAGRLRAQGKIPGVVYGLGADPVPVAVVWSELRRVLTTEAGVNALIALDIDGRRDLTIVKDLQRDPVRREVLHVDFLRVDPDAPVEVEVPIVVVGEAKEVESAKGIAEQQMKSLTVKAKPTGIPGQIEADVSSLTVGSAVTVGDLQLPDGVTTDVDPSTPVVAGVATRFTVMAAGGAVAEGGEAGEAADEAAEAAGAETGEGEENGE